MSLIKDFKNAFEKIILLTNQVNRLDASTSSLAKEVRAIDTRLVQLETRLENVQDTERRMIKLETQLEMAMRLIPGQQQLPNDK